jgi:hypothetical protein
MTLIMDAKQPLRQFYCPNKLGGLNYEDSEHALLSCYHIYEI